MVKIATSMMFSNEGFNQKIAVREGEREYYLRVKGWCKASLDLIER